MAHQDRLGRWYSTYREDGEVRRKYLGRGGMGEMLAKMDELELLKRMRQEDAEEEERYRARAVEAQVRELSGLADLAARAALLSAGCWRPARKPWCRRRRPKS